MDPHPRLHATPIAAEGRSDERWGMVLHGIYGRGRNWASVARQAVARRPDWGFWLIDLRLHGDSPAMAPPHTIAAAADDVVQAARALAAERGPVRAVIGHSFGGKVALSMAAPLADDLDQIWIVDSTPEARVPDGSAWQMLALVRSLPPRFASRAEAVAALEAQGLERGTATWMTTNLRYTDGAFTWGLDFDALEAMLRDFFATDLWEVVERPPGRVSLHFIKAVASSTLSEAACTRLEAIALATGRVHLHRVRSGHWVNTDNPTAVVDLLASELPLSGPTG